MDAGWLAARVEACSFHATEAPASQNLTAANCGTLAAAGPVGESLPQPVSATPASTSVDASFDMASLSVGVTVVTKPVMAASP